MSIDGPLKLFLPDITHIHKLKYSLTHDGYSVAPTTRYTLALKLDKVFNKAGG